MLSFTEFAKADGSGTDWQAYRAAQVANGESCSACGAFLLFGNGQPDKCRSCKALDTDRGEVSSDNRVRCPFCKHQMEPYELGLFDPQVESRMVMCHTCEQEFEVKIIVSFSFTSPAIGSKEVEG